MAIIVVLAAVAIPTFGKQLETSREAADMEVFRNVYSEVLTLATLDSLDGTLDGKNADAEDITYQGIAVASGVYTVTLSDDDATKAIVPQQKFSQSNNTWDYVNGKILGTVDVPACTSSVKTIKYTFTITPDLQLTTVAS